MTIVQIRTSSTTNNIAASVSGLLLLVPLPTRCAGFRRPRRALVMLSPPPSTGRGGTAAASTRQFGTPKSKRLGTSLLYQQAKKMAIDEEFQQLLLASTASTRDRRTCELKALLPPSRRSANYERAHVGVVQAHRPGHPEVDADPTVVPCTVSSRWIRSVTTGAAIA